MTTSNEPGWRDDPTDSNAQRYWDGQDWTPQRRRKPASAPARPAQPPPPPPPTLAPNHPPSPPASYAPLPSYVAPSPLPPPAGYPPPPTSALPPPPAWQQPGGARRSQTPIVVAAVVIGAMAIVGVLGYRYVFPGTAEDQIKAVTQTFADGFNNADPAAIASAVCSHPAESESVNMRAKLLRLSADDLRQLRDADGTVTFTVSDIRVTGDRATAKDTAVFSKGSTAIDTDSDPTEYVKENGDWKMCS